MLLGTSTLVNFALTGTVIYRVCDLSTQAKIHGHTQLRRRGQTLVRSHRLLDIFRGAALHLNLHHGSSHSDLLRYDERHHRACDMHSRLYRCRNGSVLPTEPAENLEDSSALLRCLYVA